MTTAILTRDDLDWVTFSTDEGDTCDACDAEAVAVAVFLVTCDAADRLPLCTIHRDGLTETVAAEGPYFECGSCGTEVRFLRMEPIR